LNSIEASSRAKVNFLEQLYRYHSQQGNPRVAIPTINHKPLDLWLLRKEVQKLGGYEAVITLFIPITQSDCTVFQVSKAKKWTDIGRLLGYRGIPGLSTQIKTSYSRVILPYEHFCERARHLNISSSSSTLRPNTVSAPHRTAHSNGVNGAPSNGERSGPPSPLTTTSSPLSELPDDNESKDTKMANPKLRRSTRFNSLDQNAGTLTSFLAVPCPFSKPTETIITPVVPPPVFYDRPPNANDSKSHEVCMAIISCKLLLILPDSNIVRFAGSETGEKKCFYVMAVIAVWV
jgi:[histone H3]-trimethyl-L-lysine4 demethylase